MPSWAAAPPAFLLCCRSLCAFRHLLPTRVPSSRKLELGERLGQKYRIVPQHLAHCARHLVAFSLRLGIEGLWVTVCSQGGWAAIMYLQSLLLKYSLENKDEQIHVKPESR